ncbi:hypothetical protein MITS9509_01358 [Synechococcus sp. MIT S9509]|nr:hypothetical protein MITS9509_01358 [Synechococcus sp. MIT S9509]
MGIKRRHKAGRIREDQYEWPDDSARFTRYQLALAALDQAERNCQVQYSNPRKSA